MAVQFRVQPSLNQPAPSNQIQSSQDACLALGRVLVIALNLLMKQQFYTNVRETETHEIKIILQNTTFTKKSKI